jgi:hypothetical protein
MELNRCRFLKVAHIRQIIKFSEKINFAYIGGVVLPS